MACPMGQVGAQPRKTKINTAVTSRVISASSAVLSLLRHARFCWCTRASPIGKCASPIGQRVGSGLSLTVYLCTSGATTWNPRAAVIALHLRASAAGMRDVRRSRVAMREIPPSVMQRSDTD